MKKGILKITLCVLIGLFCTNTYAYTLYKKSNIPFKLINGLIVVEAEINDTAGNFIVDTGSSDFIINSVPTADGNKASFASLGTENIQSEVTVEHLRIGDLSQSKVKAFTADLVTIEEYTSIKIMGILGANVFAPKSLMIDYNEKILQISEESVSERLYEDMYALKFKIYDNVPHAKVSIQGKTYDFILDSGATSHFVDASLIESLASGYQKTFVKKRIATAFSYDTKGDVISIDSLGLGNKELTDVRAIMLHFNKLNEGSDRKIYGLIALNNLSDRIVVDLKKNILLF